VQHELKEVFDQLGCSTVLSFIQDDKQFCFVRSLLAAVGQTHDNHEILHLWKDSCGLKLGKLHNVLIHVTSEPK
jgi:hypothetical protein